MQLNIVEWGEAQDISFHKLKQCVSKEPILRLPDFQKTFYVQTDASNYGIGAALLQEGEGKKFPVAFASKKLLPRERAYSVIERECLAIVWAIQRFQTYLYGKEFVILTDHEPLSYINSSRMVNGRIMRWSLFLQNYKFRVQMIKGSENMVADYLSRIHEEKTEL